MITVTFNLEHTWSKPEDRNLTGEVINWRNAAAGWGYDISTWTDKQVLTLWSYAYTLEGSPWFNFLGEIKRMARESMTAVTYQLNHKRRDTKLSYPSIVGNYKREMKEEGFDIDAWTSEQVLNLWDYVYTFEGDIDDNFLEEVKEMYLKNGE